MTDNHRYITALLFDLGDTIMDEGTEIKDATGTTLAAELIPGMADALRQFRAANYRLALVADSRPDTPPNVLRQHGLLNLFECLAISEVVGASVGVASIDKPDPRIFRAALDALSIPESNYGRVIMVGNNLERDIIGANRLGLISVFFYWNERRRTQPLTANETPCYTVTSVRELIELVEGLERVGGGQSEDAMQDVIPMLDYEDGTATLDWLARAFGFQEVVRVLASDGSLSHGEMMAGSGRIMFATATPDYESPKHHREHCERARAWSTVPWVIDGVLVFVADIDTHFARAREAGAVILSEPEDGPPGRRYRAEDLEGHRWMFLQRESA